MGWYGLDWSGEQGLVEGSCERGNEPRLPYNAGKFLSGCTTGGLSRKTNLHGKFYNK
jgi:hypothetical protein